MPLTIRPMKQSDVAACAAIEKTALDGWSESGLESERCSLAARLFVAEENGSIAGLVIWQLAGGEASLYTLTVCPKKRGRGIGRQLASASMKSLLAEGATAFFLEVRAGNAPAISLYQSLGFAPAGRRRDFYSNPAEDALVMSLVYSG